MRKQQKNHLMPAKEKYKIHPTQAKIKEIYLTQARNIDKLESNSSERKIEKTSNLREKNLKFI